MVRGAWRFRPMQALRNGRRICDCARTTRSNTGRCTYIAATMTLIRLDAAVPANGPRIAATRGGDRSVRGGGRGRGLRACADEDEANATTTMGPPRRLVFAAIASAKEGRNASRQGRRTQTTSGVSGARRGRKRHKDVFSYSVRGSYRSPSSSAFGPTRAGTTTARRPPGPPQPSRDPPATPAPAWAHSREGQPTIALTARHPGADLDPRPRQARLVLRARAGRAARGSRPGRLHHGQPTRRRLSSFRGFRP